MAQATYRGLSSEFVITAAAALVCGEVIQAPDGRAAVVQGSRGVASGDAAGLVTTGVHEITKTALINFLPGCRVYWDYSANSATFQKLNDRDFYVGRATKDAAAADATVFVEFNVDPTYDIDFERDPFITAIVGTQAVGGLALNNRGGGQNILITATNEAQKVDMLGVDGFATGANAIVEFLFRVPSIGAGTVVDVSVGVANATHASNADTITESIFMHLDANDLKIYFESDDGTTEVAATDSTKVFVAGTAKTVQKTVWLDMRNPADVQIYVDGINVLPATVFNVNVAAGPWFPLCHIEKSASTDTYEFSLDAMRVWLQD